jgi:hypothetical protein
MISNCPLIYENYLIRIKWKDLKIRMSKYKLIQLTNNNISGIAADNYIPLGVITRKINSTSGDCATFDVASSIADLISVDEPGYYKVTYSASFSAAAAGNLSVSLLNNQQTVYTVTATVAAADDYVNITLPYVIRICPNCCSAPYNHPVAIQLKLGEGVGLSATEPSTANLIIEKIY